MSIQSAQKSLKQLGVGAAANVEKLLSSGRGARDSAGEGDFSRQLTLTAALRHPLSLERALPIYVMPKFVSCFPKPQ